MRELDRAKCMGFKSKLTLAKDQTWALIPNRLPDVYGGIQLGIWGQGERLRLAKLDE